MKIVISIQQFKSEELNVQNGSVLAFTTRNSYLKLIFVDFPRKLNLQSMEIFKANFKCLGLNVQKR